MDTAHDPRILMAEKCSKNLKNLLTNTKGISKNILPLIEEVERKILEMKYSYAGIDDLKDYFEYLKLSMVNLINIIGGKDWSRKLKEKNVDEEKISYIKFCLNIIYNLDSRLKLKNDIAYAVDIRIGEIESVIKHPHAEKLKICNVNVGKMLTVITNLEDVKVGDKMGVALLPPVKLRGIVSEGMFLSSEKKEGEIGEFPQLNSEEINAVRKEVMKYLR